MEVGAAEAGWHRSPWPSYALDMAMFFSRRTKDAEAHHLLRQHIYELILEPDSDHRSAHPFSEPVLAKLSQHLGEDRGVAPEWWRPTIDELIKAVGHDRGRLANYGSSVVAKTGSSSVARLLAARLTSDHQMSWLEFCHFAYGRVSAGCPPPFPEPPREWDRRLAAVSAATWRRILSAWRPLSGKGSPLYPIRQLVLHEALRTSYSGLLLYDRSHDLGLVLPIRIDVSHSSSGTPVVRFMGAGHDELGTPYRIALEAGFRDAVLLAWEEARTVWQRMHRYLPRQVLRGRLEHAELVVDFSMATALLDSLPAGICPTTITLHDGSAGLAVALSAIARLEGRQTERNILATGPARWSVGSPVVPLDKVLAAKLVAVRSLGGYERFIFSGPVHREWVEPIRLLEGGLEIHPVKVDSVREAWAAYLTRSMGELSTFVHAADLAELERRLDVRGPAAPTADQVRSEGLKGHIVCCVVDRTTSSAGAALVEAVVSLRREPGTSTVSLFFFRRSEFSVQGNMLWRCVLEEMGAPPAALSQFDDALEVEEMATALAAIFTLDDELVMRRGWAWRAADVLAFDLGAGREGPATRQSTKDAEHWHYDVDKFLAVLLELIPRLDQHGTGRRRTLEARVVIISGQEVFQGVSFPKGRYGVVDLRPVEADPAEPRRGGQQEDSFRSALLRHLSRLSPPAGELLLRSLVFRHEVEKSALLSAWYSAPLGRRSLSHWLTGAEIPEGSTFDVALAELLKSGLLRQRRLHYFHDHVLRNAEGGVDPMELIMTESAARDWRETVGALHYTAVEYYLPLLSQAGSFSVLSADGLRTLYVAEAAHHFEKARFLTRTYGHAHAVGAQAPTFVAPQRVYRVLHELAVRRASVQTCLFMSVQLDRWERQGRLTAEWAARGALLWTYAREFDRAHDALARAFRLADGEATRSRRRVEAARVELALASGEFAQSADVLIPLVADLQACGALPPTRADAISHALVELGEVDHALNVMRQCVERRPEFLTLTLLGLLCPTPSSGELDAELVRLDAAVALSGADAMERRAWERLPGWRKRGRLRILEVWERGLEALRRRGTLR